MTYKTFYPLQKVLLSIGNGTNQIAIHKEKLYDNK